jgi:hypothetical protein
MNDDMQPSERLPIRAVRQREASMQFHPRQIVVLFDDTQDSGATLGYYGTVVEVDPNSVAKHANQPDRWKYVVYIPFLNDNRIIRGANLFPTDEYDSLNAELGPACEVQFETNAQGASDFIPGRYRMAGHATWTAFEFIQATCHTAEVQLTLPAPYGRSGRGQLTCRVPNDTVLDRTFVLRVLGDICGQQRWREVQS